MRVALIGTINSSSLFCLSLIAMAGSSTKKTSVTAAQRLTMPSTASTPSDAPLDPITYVTSPTPSTPSAEIMPSPIHLSTNDMLPLLPIYLIETHDRLLQSGSYLGDRSLQDKVMWVRDGNRDLLIRKPAADVVLDDSGVPPGGHDLADLSAVGVVSASDFWMTADGGYRGPSPFCSCLANVKPSLVLETPDSTPYNVDFTETIRNLLWLQEQKSTPGFGRRGLLLGKDLNQFKICHVLFELLVVRPSDADFLCKDLPPEFEIRRWPVSSIAARAELPAIVNTHCVIPIPVYDMYRTLVSPNLYQSHLVGALVEVHFTITHWSIGPKCDQSSGGAADTYMADVVSIRVIAPPKPQVRMPRKRTTAMKDPFADYDRDFKKLRAFPRGMGRMC
ncbi:hypothetical protein EW146_g8136 [Bondarzewia mesenterica]|uniref:Uncharacterized protein n=1 Tax=Bondarzewia mesenterica TaxID=1095465 RepID=A0A4V3XDV0_9AGAM|nr:hypothetical protein EW146_g8136 [Bondarzewia mesenterica]